MTDRIRDIVIVGGGLAAGKAAETLRTEGFDGHLALIAAEPHRPYERPPLSKDVLVGQQPVETVYIHPEEFYAEHDIDLLTGDPATDLDRDASAITTRSGAELKFDRLLLATGADPRQLPLTDRDLHGIVTLRTIDDATRLGARLQQIGHVTIVGAGWIGCEVAAAARTLGVEATLVDPLEVPLQRVLGVEVGTVFADLHRDHGVDLRLGVGVTGADGADQVERVTLSDGTSVDTELVVVGIGVLPRTDLAERAGIELDDGILADATLASSDPRILVAGDVANAWHPHYRRHLRVEHWANALNQGQTAAANLLGAGQTYDRLPYFFSDQYELGMEYVGHASSEDHVVFRGDRDAGEFIAFWLDDQRITAAMNVNVWDVVEDLKTLIQTAQPVEPDRLADPDTPLTDLIAGTA